jgi:hypothetical protein
MDVSQLGTLPHHKPPLVVCCRLVLLVSGLADGHLVRWATVPATRTSPGDTVALLVVPPSAQSTPWPWQPRGRWRKWVVVRYRAAQRTCQQATWARPPPWGAIAAAWRADHVDGVRLADLGPTPASVGCFARLLSACLKNKIASSHSTTTGGLLFCNHKGQARLTRNSLPIDRTPDSPWHRSVHTPV